ncbi:unnamed protein product [Gongylonema pulchrum]|uniref:Kinase n=1 Tax=Gongylonema pulchrum TaxID=637853 RepID=A0A183DS06_9BILA|nr:unnamed protein product [Gongylonema pulchrum]
MTTCIVWNEAEWTCFHFYASSILLAYEGCAQRPPNAVVKLIDFSHIFPAHGTTDGNYLFGLDNVIRFIASHRSFLCTC